MFTIKENVNDELIINKSKFITYVYNVKSKDDINNIINELKSKYKDATHYCYAYIVGNEKRFNDDKEPSHTAGMPILNVLESKKLNNILAVVIRYFGGIKLGAGGLVRAYTNSVVNTLNKTDIIEDIKTYKIKIEFKYSDIDAVNYILKDYKITYKEFDENIIYEFIYEENNFPDKLNNIIIKKELIN